VADDLSRAIDELEALDVAPPVDVRAEAAALAATGCQASPEAGPDWAVAFGLPAGVFRHAAAVGSSFDEAPTPVLADLNAASGHDRSRPGAYARGLAEVAMAAASLGELTIAALARATVIGNAQLTFAGVTGSSANAGPSAGPGTGVRAKADRKNPDVGSAAPSG
jgi:hypothetical protein